MTTLPKKDLIKLRRKLQEYGQQAISEGLSLSPSSVKKALLGERSNESVLRKAVELAPLTAEERAQFNQKLDALNTIKA